jgi:ADP-heptose:LPS heptosyltransferase
VDKPNLIQRLGYTQAVSTRPLSPAYVQRNLQLLAAWRIPAPASPRLEIAADPALAVAAAQLLPEGRVVCHLATSQPRKEWPIERWREFYRLARSAGFALAFSSGTSARERALLEQLKQLEPDIFALPALPGLALFLAVLRRARAVVAGDTGPLHFAAGLGVPVVGLFGTEDSLLRAAPNYEDRHVVKATEFVPGGGGLDSADADDHRSWVACIPAERVLAALTGVVAR